MLRSEFEENNIVRKIITVVLSIAVTAIAVADPVTSTYYFDRITSNSSIDVASQLSVNVWADSNSSTTVHFQFFNTSNTASSIEGIYFIDGTLLEISNIEWSDDFGPPNTGRRVRFSEGADPGHLPGGGPEWINPTRGFTADSDNPPVHNGVNHSLEWVDIQFSLQDDQTYADTIAALASGALRIGLHVQGILPDDEDESDSFVNNLVIPGPGAALLGAFGLGIAGLVKRRMA